MPMLKNFPAELLDAQQPPCLSLYQPTHRHYPENKQDPIRFRNLVKEMDRSLRLKYSPREIEPLLEPFLDLASDSAFWKRSLDGLAVLGAPGLFRIHRLQRSVPELAVVADSFHTKPLLRICQSTDRYQILGLTRREIRLFEGNRDALDEIEPAPGVPRTITDALGEELTEPHQTVASYKLGAGATAARHGHGSRKDELGSDTERFFRAVDRAVLEHHSKPSNLPLLLAALPEYHTPFRRVSRNPLLLAEDIDAHPDGLSLDELRRRAWKTLEPHYHARMDELAEEFRQARAKGLGADDLADISAAAVTGRIATLLIDADLRIPGRIDASSGRIERAAEGQQNVDDLLDDLGELVLKLGGGVAVIPSERLPADSGAAAIYRF